MIPRASLPAPSGSAGALSSPLPPLPHARSAEGDELARPSAMLVERLWVRAELDGLRRRLAREVPGFSGMFYDETGRLNVYLAGVQPLAAAEVVAERLLPRLQARGLALAAAEEVVVRQGEYDFPQLSRWHQQALGVFEVGGVVFTDADERSNRLRIGIEIHDPPFFTGGIFCPQAWRCRFSDAAGARYALDVNVVLG